MSISYGLSGLNARTIASCQSLTLLLQSCRVLPSKSTPAKLTQSELDRNPARKTLWEPVTGIVEDDISQSVPKSTFDNVQVRLDKSWLGYDAFSETSVTIASHNI